MERLLIIDDEPAVSRLIRTVAEGCGYAVTVTNEAAHFTDEILAKEHDVIVLDLSLPDVDGVELLRFLGMSKCRAKIIIISGFDARVLETTGKLGLELGLSIASTLSKPIRIADLRSAIADIRQKAA